MSSVSAYRDKSGRTKIDISGLLASDDSDTDDFGGFPDTENLSETDNERMDESLNVTVFGSKDVSVPVLNIDDDIDELKPIEIDEDELVANTGSDLQEANDVKFYVNDKTDFVYDKNSKAKSDTNDKSVVCKSSLIVSETSSTNDMEIVKEILSKKIEEKKEASVAVFKPKNLEACMVAFRKGWVRELVYRNPPENSATPLKTKADVYYYTPEGRKLRSKVEIEDYLLEQLIIDLSIENFTFQREPLCVDSKYERVRHASRVYNLKPKEDYACPSKYDSSEFRVIKRSTGGPIEIVVPSKTLKVEDIKTRTCPGAEKKLTICVSTGNSPNVNSSNLKRALVGNCPAELTPKPKKVCSDNQRKRKGLSVELSLKLEGAIETPSFPSAVLTPLLKENYKKKTYHCTPMCDMARGTVPNLSCMKCLCLFHAECCFMPKRTVELISCGVAKFLCPNCYMEIRSQVQEPPKHQSFCHESLYYDLSSENEDEGVVEDLFPNRVLVESIRPPSPPDSCHWSAPSKIKIAPIQPQPASLNSPSYPLNFSSPQPNTRMQEINSQNQLNFPRFISGQYPGNNIYTQQPMHQPYQSLPVSSNPSLLLRGRPQTAITSPYQIVFPPTVNPVQQQCIPSQPAFVSPSHFLILPQQATPNISNEFNAIAATIREVDSKFNRAAFLGEVSCGYRALKIIFRYLDIPTLLKARQVCIMWNDMATNPSLWKHVKLNKVYVNNWKKFSAFLTNCCTEIIDLRGMINEAKQEKFTNYSVSSESALSKKYNFDTAAESSNKCKQLSDHRTNVEFREKFEKLDLPCHNTVTDDLSDSSTISVETEGSLNIISEQPCESELFKHSESKCETHNKEELCANNTNEDSAILSESSMEVDLASDVVEHDCSLREDICRKDKKDNKVISLAGNTSHLMGIDSDKCQAEDAVDMQSLKHDNEMESLFTEEGIINAFEGSAISNSSQSIDSEMQLDIKNVCSQNLNENKELEVSTVQKENDMNGFRATEKGKVELNASNAQGVLGICVAEEGEDEVSEASKLYAEKKAEMEFNEADMLEVGNTKEVISKNNDFKAEETQKMSIKVCKDSSLKSESENSYIESEFKEVLKPINSELFGDTESDISNKRDFMDLSSVHGDEGITDKGSQEESSIEYMLHESSDNLKTFSMICSNQQEVVHGEKTELNKVPSSAETNNEIEFTLKTDQHFEPLNILLEEIPTLEKREKTDSNMNLEDFSSNKCEENSIMKLENTECRSNLDTCNDSTIETNFPDLSDNFSSDSGEKDICLEAEKNDDLNSSNENNIIIESVCSLQSDLFNQSFSECDNDIILNSLLKSNSVSKKIKESKSCFDDKLELNENIQNESSILKKDSKLEIKNSEIAYEEIEIESVFSVPDSVKSVTETKESKTLDSKFLQIEIELEKADKSKGLTNVSVASNIENTANSVCNDPRNVLPLEQKDEGLNGLPSEYNTFKAVDSKNEARQLERDTVLQDSADCKNEHRGELLTKDSLTENKQSKDVPTSVLHLQPPITDEAAVKEKLDHLSEGVESYAQSIYNVQWPKQKAIPVSFSDSNVETISKYSDAEETFDNNKSSKEKPTEVEECFQNAFTKEEILNQLSDDQKVLTNICQNNEMLVSNIVNYSKSKDLNNFRVDKMEEASPHGIVAAELLAENLVTDKLEGASRHAEGVAELPFVHFDIYHTIGRAFCSISSLRKVILGECSLKAVENILCNSHIKSISAIISSTEGTANKLDLSYLLQAPKLKEMRIESREPLEFGSNFNFLKVPHLETLVLSGLSDNIATWPYFGVNLTSLHLDSLASFPASNWSNIADMKGLRNLCLGNCSCDQENLAYSTFQKLPLLSHLTLLNWPVSKKVTRPLKRMPNLKHFFVLPVSDKTNDAYQAGCMTIVAGRLPKSVYFVWAVHSSTLTPQNCIRIQRVTVGKPLPESPVTSLMSLAEVASLLAKINSNASLQLWLPSSSYYLPA